MTTGRINQVAFLNDVGTAWAWPWLKATFNAQNEHNRRSQGAFFEQIGGNEDSVPIAFTESESSSNK